jgi:hypothetical protein
MSNAAWVAVGVIVAGGAAVLTLLKVHSRKSDHGAVSDQWVAEHRADHILDR